MQNSQPKNQISWLQAIRQSKPVSAFNRFCVSPWGLAILGALTLTSYAFELELYFYGLIIAYVVYNCLFGEDFLPFIPLFVFCYISPSAGNNPGKAETSIFYGSHGGIIILCLAAVALLSLILRIATDPDMGFKKVFTQKRSLIFGFLALGVAYLLSGIGSEHYTEIAGKNLLFSALQFLSLFLLYFLFSATVKWENVDKKYFAWFAVILGLTVVGQVIHIYLTQNVIVDNIVNGSVVGKKIKREHIYTGWGMYNNIGAIIAISVPFALYLATTYRHGYAFIAVATLLIVATVFTCSRGSMLGAVLAFTAAFISACIKSKYRISLILTMLIILCVGAGIFFLFEEEIAILFAGVPDLFESENLPEINSFWDLLYLFNDSNRFSTYKEGLKVFRDNPFFGDSFYPSDFAPWDFSELEQFSSFFPPRWHNTVVQLLASCGAIGLCAYAFHRVQTLILLFKKPTVTKSFIAISIGVLLLMSLLDCHIFNIGPGFFYSAALVFAENLGKKKKTETKE